ncbi:MAG TPA: A/G-specific adenine glycosylase [Terriglobales bacterium]|nr:A/G-specific adenine glycosylase [Terriglobales bacterium]
MRQLGAERIQREPGRFRRLLLDWYQRHHRKLPWRGETDPYPILVSEIMLQQTRVAVVESRYKEFLRRFPTIQKLARAREQSVLAAWSGLGYYRRARSLRQAAIKVVRRRGFPRTAAELEALPGVGRYTAAAVASIAFGEPVPVVDGNVKRVFSRVAGRDLTDSECWNLAGELLERRRPGDFNQAIMELGATVCLPSGNPRCSACPVGALCSWRGTRRQSTVVFRRKAELKYRLVRGRDMILLRRRPSSSSLMPSMWELPETTASMKTKPLLKLRHSITHTNYRVLVFAGRGSGLKGAKWVSLRDADRLPLTGLTRKILREVRSARV